MIGAGIKIFGQEVKKSKSVYVCACVHVIVSYAVMCNGCIIASVLFNLQFCTTFEDWH